MRWSRLRVVALGGLLSVSLLFTCSPRSLVRWFLTAQDTIVEKTGLEGKLSFPSTYNLPAEELMALKRVLEAASGATSSRPMKAASVKWNGRTVLLTTCNSAYFDFFLNGACHVQRIKPAPLKYVAWAQDRMGAASFAMYHANEGQRDSGAHFFYSADMSAALGMVSRAGHFRSHGFNRLTLFKLVAIRIVLQSEYAVCLSDVDVVLLSDPFRHFRGPALCDYEYAPNSCGDGRAPQQEALGEGNTGFHLLQPSDGVLRLLGDTLEDGANTPSIDDQTLLWARLITSHRNRTAIYVEDDRHGWSAGKRVSTEALKTEALRRPRRMPPAQGGARDPLRYCALPRRTHPVGACLGAAGHRHLDQSVVAVHANFASTPNKKVEMLVDAGLWALDAGAAAGGCAPLPAGLWASAAWLWALAFHRPAFMAITPAPVRAAASAPAAAAPSLSASHHAPATARVGGEGVGGRL